MFNESEKKELKMILDKFNNLYHKKINYSNIENNLIELNEVILFLYRLKLYAKQEELEKISKIELKLWNYYFSLTGIKHQHDLFCEMNELDDESKKEKLREIAQNKKYSNLYFADISKYGKSYFQYSAEVLIMRGYPEVDDVISKLFIWLQDINWPGSYEIYKFLCTIPKDALLKSFENNVKEAYQTNDTCWLYWLQQLMKNFHLTKKNFKNKILYDILNKEIEY